MLNIHTLKLGDYETNCYLLWADDRRECLVIDPGFQPEKVLSTLKMLGKELTAILLTHGHFDHVGGVKALFAETDCDIYLCPSDCKMPEQMTAGPLSYTCSYQQGDTLCLAGLTLQVLHTPGHTPGSVCLLCENALFSGDTLFSGSCGRTDLPCGDWQQLQRSLLQLRELPDQLTVYPGHGFVTTLGTEKRYNPYMQQ